MTKSNGRLGRRELLLRGGIGVLGVWTGACGGSAGSERGRHEVPDAGGHDVGAGGRGPYTGSGDAADSPYPYGGDLDSAGVDAAYRDRAGCSFTEDNIEGPFYLAGAPMRAALARSDTPGTPLVIEGRVVDLECRPIANAVLDFWQADHLGAYDGAGFGFRGRQATAEDGSYRLVTVVPGHYLNGSQYRPAHVHVKVWQAEHELLTTQLYFEGDPYNDIDPFIRDSLILQLESDGGRIAQFDFVV